MERSLPPEEPEELSQELSAERELENVFRKFQKGVQEQYGKEDYETHYNLGVAYREMGLLNEAITEFRLVLKSPDRVISATAMIASCLRAKGALPRAEETLLEVLNNPKYSKSEGIAGLAYELGQIFEVQGRIDDALAQYYRAKELEPDHKEAAVRISQLERRSTGPSHIAPPQPSAGAAPKRSPDRPTAPTPARPEGKTERKKVSYL
jgi:tetratricopeptide (TPR) repeat protein